MLRIALLIATLLLVPTLSLGADQPQLWLYLQTNLLPNENVDKIDLLFQRAGKAGYSQVLLADYKTEVLDQLGSNTKPYTANVERVKKLAAANHLQIVPAVFSVGYSSALLAHDPNLAEGLPVVDTPFVVNGDIARIDADPAVTLQKLSYKDDVVALHDGIADVDNATTNARLIYELHVPKYRAYHVHAEVKTDDFRGDARIAINVDDHSLCNMNAKIQPTQDWSPVDAIFNSLDHEKVAIYLGVWGPSRGKLHWRHWSIEEIGPLNVLRRAGTPLVIRDEHRALVEGKDVDRIVDPKLGNQPWAGAYSAWHAIPTIRTHGLPDGTRLKISWYYPPVANDDQVEICLSEPKTMKILADQTRAVRKLWGTAGYMMSHDEIRCANWDGDCQSRNLPPGKMLAENVKRCAQLLDGSTVYVWSDMFDPNHNAVDHYYLTRGDLAGSWEGVDPSVTIVNWNFDKRDASLKFFADRGNKQLVAGYYDGDVNQIRNWLTSAKKVNGVVGYMYTTWNQNYSDLESFANLVRE